MTKGDFCMKSGLVSITFRNKTVCEIAALCEKANLSCVEWGGDVHVPPKGGKAREALKITTDHGLFVSSYGSYFRLGQGRDQFLYNLDEASEMNAPVIRIWAGTKASDLVQTDERKYLTDELMMVSEISYKAGIRTTLEYHPNTLTDDRKSVLALLKETSGEDFSPMFYWQPRWDWNEEESFSALMDVKERLSHIHVFSWTHTENAIIRNPIANGERLLNKALNVKKEGCALIEFVKDDLDENLLRDAKTLNNWISGRK